MWVILALTSAACFGVVSVIDKRLLDHHLPGVSVLYLWIALVLSFYAGLVLLLTGLPSTLPGMGWAWHLCPAWLSGLVWR